MNLYITYLFLYLKIIIFNFIFQVLLDSYQMFISLFMPSVISLFGIFVLWLIFMNKIFMKQNGTVVKPIINIKCFCLSGDIVNI